MRILVLGLPLALAGCATAPAVPVPPPVAATPAAGPTEVQILAINDFHGNLEPPKMTSTAPGPGGTGQSAGRRDRPSGDCASKTLRAGHPDTITVSAGDMIGASPLASALYPRRADDRGDKSASGSS